MRVTYDAQVLAEDLAYLQANAFETSIEFNPEASYHTPVPDRHAFTEPGAGTVPPDWLSADQRAEGLATGRYVVARVYPRGSVGFYEVAGTDLLEVIHELAILCGQELGVNPTGTETPENLPKAREPGSPP